MTESLKEVTDECFVIMPISDQPGYDEGHFAEVYCDLIVPAVEAAGFKASRADKVMKASNIHIDILTKLRRAPIAVCDISGRNPNVFFELAFRQSFDMPVVIIKDDKTDNPFDLISIRHILYDSKMKYKNVMESRQEICSFLKETLRDSRTNSLLSLLSIEEKATLVESKITPELAAIEVLLNKIDGLSSRISDIESMNRRMRDPVIARNISVHDLEIAGLRTQEAFEKFELHRKATEAAIRAAGAIKGAQPVPPKKEKE